MEGALWLWRLFEDLLEHLVGWEEVYEEGDQTYWEDEVGGQDDYSVVEEVSFSLDEGEDEEEESGAGNWDVEIFGQFRHLPFCCGVKLLAIVQLCGK